MPKQDEEVEEEVSDEEVEGDEEQAQTDADRKTDKPAVDNRVPLARLNEVIAERDKERKAREKLERDTKEANRKKLEEENNYKTLYEQTSAELTKYQSLETELTGYKNVLEETLESVLSELTEEAKLLVPEDLPIDKKLKWISKNRKILAKPSAFDIGVGKKGTGSKKPVVKLTSNQLEVAERFGMAPEEYAKFADIPSEEQS